MKAEIVQQILNIKDDQWWESIFRQDPMYNRLGKDQIEQFITLGVTTGEEYALRKHQQLQERELSDIVEDLGIDLKFEEEYGFEGLVVFANFSQPNTIRIFKKNIILFKKFMEDENITDMPPIDVEKTLFYHELFHFFEVSDDALKLDNIRFESFRIGPIKLKSRLIALSEIAAMSFTRKLTESPVNPCALNILMQMPHDYKRAVKNLENLTLL